MSELAISNEQLAISPRSVRNGRAVCPKPPQSRDVVSDTVRIGSGRARVPSRAAEMERRDWGAAFRMTLGRRAADASRNMRLGGQRSALPTTAVARTITHCSLLIANLLFPLLALAFTAFASPLHAAETPSAIVTTGEDIVDPDDGLISFREAIAYAGTGGLGNTVSFSFPINNFNSEEVHLANKIVINKNITVDFRDVVSGDMVLTYWSGDDVYVEIAAGAHVEFSGGHIYSTDNEDISFSDAFINHGELTLNRMYISGCVANSGVLRLENSFINYTNDNGPGGAVYNAATGTATLDSSAFYDSTLGFLTWELEPSEAGGIVNDGTLRVENCFFNQDQIADISYAFNCIVNRGTATIDGASFYYLPGRGQGAAIANGTNAVLQVNNASFFLAAYPMITCEKGGKVLVANSSFSNNFFLWAGEQNWDTDDYWFDIWVPHYDYCFRLNGEQNDLRVYNCAFDTMQVDVLEEGVEADVRGCVFGRGEGLSNFSEARIRNIGEVGAVSLLPVTNLTSFGSGIPLRNNGGTLNYRSGSSWTATGVQIPNFPNASLQNDMFGDARSQNSGSSCFPGASVDPNGPEHFSCEPTTTLDITDPYDGQISLREAVSYSRAISIVMGSPMWTDVSIPPSQEPYEVTAGPIVIDTDGYYWDFYPTDYNCYVEIRGNGTSGIFDFRRKSSWGLSNLCISNAATAGNGGAVNVAAGGKLCLRDCHFEDCAAAGSGGAVYLPAAGFVLDDGGISFVRCSAGENGGGIACGSLHFDFASFEDCSATGSGGAIWAGDGYLSRVCFKGNTAGERGGAIAGGISDIDIACFTSNTASEGAAVYFTGSNRKVLTNASFIGNTCTTESSAVIIVADGGILRLGNVDEWNNTVSPEGNIAVGLDNAEISVFNSILPEQSDNGSLITDSVTLLDFTNDLQSVLYCESDGAPSLCHYLFDESSDWYSGNMYLQYTSLAARKDNVSTAIGRIYDEDGSFDLAYYDSDTEVWRTADGEEVLDEVNDIYWDMRGKQRADNNVSSAAEYGLGPLSHCSPERMSLVVTTLEDVVDPYDMRISLREAIDTAKDIVWCESWDYRPDDNIRFDLGVSTNRTLHLSDDVEISGSEAHFPIDDPLVFDGLCPDGTGVTIDFDGHLLNIEVQETFGVVFRNLEFLNMGSEIDYSNMDQMRLYCGIILTALYDDIEGSASFENCSFINGIAYDELIRSEAFAVSFSNCLFSANSGRIVNAYYGHKLVNIENCVFDGTFLWDSMINSQRLFMHNVTVRGSRMSEPHDLISLGGDCVHTILNAAFVDNKVNDFDPGSSYKGCVVSSSFGIVEFGNVTCGGNEGFDFLNLYGGGKARILNSAIDGDCARAPLEGCVCSASSLLIESPVGGSRHAAVEPPPHANPGTPVGVYEKDGEKRLAVRVNGVWYGADSEVLKFRNVTMETTDLFGVSRIQGGQRTCPRYTAGAVSVDVETDFVVTTAEDVLNPAGGKLSFRKVLQMFKNGQTCRNGRYVVTFAIPDVQNPVIQLKQTVTLEDDIFTPANPLVIFGDNGKGKVTFDGRGKRSIFQFEEEGGLELHNCVLTGGNGDYGGSVNVGTGELGLYGVTISNSYASVIGGGVNAGDISMKDCMFFDCVSENRGGAISIAANGSLTAENCAFYFNESEGAGGAIYGRSDVYATIDRVTFYGNYSGEGAAIYLGSGSFIYLENAVLCENELGFDDSGIIYSESSETTMMSSTTWNNFILGTTTPAALLQKWGGTYNVFSSLFGEALPAGISYGEDTNFSNLNNDSSCYVISNGVPYTGQTIVDGVLHTFRLPSDGAIKTNLSSLFYKSERDLFGKVRGGVKSCGAVDYLSYPPVYPEDDGEIYVQPRFAPAAVNVYYESVKVSTALLGVGDGAETADVFFACGTDPANLGAPVLLFSAAEAGDNISTNLMHLAPETTYYFAFTAVNDAANPANGSLTGSFTTKPTPDLTNLGDLLNFARITVGDNVTAEMSDVPVLVRLSENNPVGFHYAECKADGSDIRFGDADLNVIPHEIDTWNPNGESLIWIRPSSFAAGDVIYLFYNGEPAASANPALVWSGYTGVWHLNETTDPTSRLSIGTYPNSTAAEGIDGNLSSYSVPGEAGRFGKSFRVNRATATKDGNFDYGGVWVDDSGTDSPLDCGGTFTISGWFKHGNFNYYYDKFFYKRTRSDNTTTDGATYTGAFAIELSANNNATAYPAPRGNSTSTSVRNVAYPVDMKDNWAYLTFVYDGATVHVYENGVFVFDSEIDEATDNDSPLVFGNNCNIAAGEIGNAAWCGWIDEVRLVDDVKSADWVAAEYVAMTGGILEYDKVETLSHSAPILTDVSSRVYTDFAKVSATLAFAGDEATTADISFVYGTDPDNLGAFAAAESNVAAGDTVSMRLRSLAPETTYYFAFKAVNPGGDEKTVTGNFTTMPQRDKVTPIWFGDFTRAVEFTTSGYTGESTLRNYPVLVKLSESGINGFDYSEFASYNGSDIRFVDSDGQLLSHEIVSWNPDGESEIWVKIPSVTSATKFTMYYGVKSGVAVSATATWSGYTGVWHMEESTGTVADATGHGLTATPSGVAATNQTAEAGAVGKARVNSTSTADANRAYLSIPDYNSFGLGSTFTMSGWIKMTNCTAYPRIFSRKVHFTDSDGWEMQMNSGSMSQYTVRGAAQDSFSSEFTVPLNEGWSQVVLVYNDTQLSVYQNGALVHSGTVTPATDNGCPLSFGCDSDGNETHLVGSFDEIRLWNGCASADLIKADYDQIAGSGFLVASAVKAVVAGEHRFAEPVVTVDADSATVSAVLSVVGQGARKVDVYFAYGTDPAHLGAPALLASPVEAGDNVEANLTDLAPGTTYYFEFTAENVAADPSIGSVAGSFTTDAFFGYREGDEVGGLVISTAQAEWLNGYLDGFADKAAQDAAIVAAAADGIGLADKYMLNLDPTTADSYEFAVTGIEVDGATVTVTVTLTRANGVTAVTEPIRGTLKLRGTAELGTAFGATTAQDISGAFSNTTTETFEFTDEDNKFFKAVIE